MFFVFERNIYMMAGTSLSLTRESNWVLFTYVAKHAWVVLNLTGTHRGTSCYISISFGVGHVHGWYRFGCMFHSIADDLMNRTGCWLGYGNVHVHECQLVGQLDVMIILSISAHGFTASWPKLLQLRFCAENLGILWFFGGPWEVSQGLVTVWIRCTSGPSHAFECSVWEGIFNDHSSHAIIHSSILHQIQYMYTSVLIQYKDH